MTNLIIWVKLHYTVFFHGIMNYFVQFTQNIKEFYFGCLHIDIVNRIDFCWCINFEQHGNKSDSLSKHYRLFFLIRICFCRIWKQFVFSKYHLHLGKEVFNLNFDGHFQAKPIYGIFCWQMAISCLIPSPVNSIAWHIVNERIERISWACVILLFIIGRWKFRQSFFLIEWQWKKNRIA